MYFSDIKIHSIKFNNNMIYYTKGKRALKNKNHMNVIYVFVSSKFNI